MTRQEKQLLIVLIISVSAVSCGAASMFAGWMFEARQAWNYGGALMVLGGIGLLAISAFLGE